MLKIKSISLFYILTVFISFPLFASQSSFKNIKNQISEYEGNVTQIKASLRTLDSRIDSQNQNYLKRLEKEKALEGKLDELEVGLKVNKEKIISKLQQIKKKYLSVTLNSDESNITSKYQEQLLLRQLGEEGKSLEKSLIKNKKLSQVVGKLSSELKELKKEKGELYSILNDLEGKKTTIKNTYFKSLEEKKKLETELARRKLERIAQPAYNEGIKLIAPVSHYSNVERTLQGINFFFTEDAPILSVASGKVVYTGQLSSFGTVVMVKHNEKMRSVILGPFRSKVKRGEQLQKGDVIGYSISKGIDKKNRKIYVELRKNEKALQTANYMDSSLKI